MHSYLTGSQGLFIDLFPASADWYHRLGVGKSGMVHDIKLPEGLVKSQKFPEPLFTPSTRRCFFILKSLFNTYLITTAIVAASGSSAQPSTSKSQLSLSPFTKPLYPTIFLAALSLLTQNLNSVSYQPPQPIHLTCPNPQTNFSHLICHDIGL